MNPKRVLSPHHSSSLAPLRSKDCVVESDGDSVKLKSPPKIQFPSCNMSFSIC